MKAIYRDTRMKLSNNPTGLLFNLVILKLVKKIAVKLRAFRAAAVLIVFIFASCTKPSSDPSTCIDGECSAFFELQATKDNNGYYHIDLDFSQQYYPRFTIDVTASITNPEYWYNNSPVVYSNFETNTYWTYNTDRLPIVQGTKIYLSKKNNSTVTGKRVVGPIPPEFKGDTLEIYPRIFWDSGIFSVEKNFSLKIIVE